MKKLLVLVSILSISFYSCSSDDDELESYPVVVDNGIVGQWKLIESFHSTGGASEWYTVEDGYTITFLANGEFETTKEGCQSGTYKVLENPYSPEEEMIELSYSCDLDQERYPENKFYLGIDVLNENSLVYHPTFKSPRCLETCSSKLEKQ